MKIREGADTLDTALSLLDRAYNWLPLVIGTAGVSAISGWAAYVSQSVAQFGPIAWISAALIGGLLFLLLYLLWLRSRLLATRLIHAHAMMERTDTVNPLESVFTRKRIRLDDLKLPLVQPVAGKTFVDCELVGPAVILFGGQANLSHVGFVCCDFVAIKDQTLVQNVLPLIDVTIRGGKIYQATILVGQSAVPRMPKDAHWITC